MRCPTLTTWLAMSIGCGFPDPSVGNGSGSGEEHDTGTTDTATTIPLPPDPSATSTTLPTTLATATAGDDEGVVFLMEPDAGDDHEWECDMEYQDCEPGFKCMPYSTRRGEWWTDVACFPVDPNAVGLGEPCQWTGEPWSGYDNCGWGQMCWAFQPDEVGVCKGMCLDPEPHGGGVECEDPTAIPYVGCQSCICVCEPTCDPLAQDCGEGQVCLPTNDGFICYPDGSGEVGAYGDECNFINDCDPGLLCMNADHVPGCPWTCCTPYCDLTQPNTCPGAAEGQECLPWYQNEAPPGLEDVGVCALPP
jgi:hypothetical protein